MAGTQRFEGTTYHILYVMTPVMTRSSFSTVVLTRATAFFPTNLPKYLLPRYLPR